MHRTFATLAPILCFPCLCFADEPKKTEVAPAPVETVIRITVHPMAAPVPALKYQLLPELTEMNPGNPIQGYLKCFMEQKEFFFGKESEELRDKWLEMPLKDLPVETILQRYGGHPLTDADYAARLDTPDWQILLKLKSDGMMLLLPDIQQMRTLWRALQVRCRAEIAAGKFNNAVVTLKTLFAMSRHHCEHPTLVANLVGFAISGAALRSLEEMVQQPGAPNLFWAESSLPSPLVGFASGLQGEWVIVEKEIEPLERHSPMTDAELQRAIDHLDAMLDLEGGTKKRGDVRKSLEAKARDKAELAKARRLLADAGFDSKQLDHSSASGPTGGAITESGSLGSKQLERFSPLQTVLASEAVEVHRRRDDGVKSLMLPYWQFEAVLAANRKEYGGEPAPAITSSTFWDVFEHARSRQAELEQRLSQLRCIEALRMYGADHDGKLPERLDDVPVPVPLDPVSGKPFSYKLDGAKATLHGEPAGDKPGEWIVYEITMQK